MWKNNQSGLLLYCQEIKILTYASASCTSFFWRLGNTGEYKDLATLTDVTHQ
jgi:hypothetical protein